MFIGDALLVTPLFLILVLVAMLLRGQVSLMHLGVLLATLSWPWDARLIRSQVLSLREREFTRTAILSGTGTIKLVRNEYLPFVMPLVFATLISNMSFVIGLEITLSILGLTNPNIPTLGTMLQGAMNYQALFLELWSWLLTPIVLSVLLFIALYWLSVSISEYLDPRTRIQRVGTQ